MWAWYIKNRNLTVKEVTKKEYYKITSNKKIEFLGGYFKTKSGAEKDGNKWLSIVKGD